MSKWKIVILLIILIIFAQQANAQRDTSSSRYSVLYIKLGVGANMSVTSLKEGAGTDHLLAYDDESYYWQIISGNVFISRNWGIEITVQSATSSRNKKRDEKFYRGLEMNYDEQYYLTYDFNFDEENSRIFGGQITKGYLGLVHRYERQRFIILSRFLAGIISYSANWGTAYLKERGENNLTKIQYNPSTEFSIDHFVVAPALTLGYKFSSGIIINVDIQYSYFNNNFKYDEKVMNLYAQEEFVKQYSYNRKVETLTIGGGIIFDIERLMGNL